MGKESSENASVVEQIDKSIGSISKWFKDMYKQDRDTRKRQQQFYEQQRLKHRIWLHMCQIQLELFEVFQHNRYPRLIRITSPDDIRIDGFSFQKREQMWVYFFTIDKTDFEEIAHIVCDSIRDKMNRDIFTFQKRLYYSAPDVQMMYPNMVYGIRVVNVENRIDCVRIAVITAIEP